MKKESMMFIQNAENLDYNTFQDEGNTNTHFHHPPTFTSSHIKHLIPLIVVLVTIAVLLIAALVFFIVQNSNQSYKQTIDRAFTLMNKGQYEEMLTQYVVGYDKDGAITENDKMTIRLLKNVEWKFEETDNTTVSPNDNEFAAKISELVDTGIIQSSDKIEECVRVEGKIYMNSKSENGFNGFSPTELDLLKINGKWKFISNPM